MARKDSIHPKEFACKKMPGECRRCTACCHIRSARRWLSEDEEDLIKRQTFEKTGVFYIFPMHMFTVSVTGSEKAALAALAEKKGIGLSFSPKKMVLSADGKLYVLDWFIDHDICPLLDGKDCIAYDIRPEVCRRFPAVENIDGAGIAAIFSKNSIVTKKTDYDAAISTALRLFEDGRYFEPKH